MRVGRIVVMDTSAPVKGRVGKLTEGRSRELAYLPPSAAPPNLNPVEEAFAIGLRALGEKRAPEPAKLC